MLQTLFNKIIYGFGFGFGMGLSVRLCSSLFGYTEYNRKQLYLNDHN